MYSRTTRRLSAYHRLERTVSEDKETIGLPDTALTLEDGTYRLFRNVGNYQYTLRNSTEEGRSH
jgi:hypothetical protein